MARLAGRPRIAGSKTNGGALDQRKYPPVRGRRAVVFGGKDGVRKPLGPDSTDPDRISFAPFSLPFQSPGDAPPFAFVIVLKNVIVNDHNLCFTWGIGA